MRKPIMLFLPARNASYSEKALTSRADALIIDTEDARRRGQEGYGKTVSKSLSLAEFWQVEICCAARYGVLHPSRNSACQ